MLRIDFDAAAAARLADADTLSAVLAAAFGQRRKQIGSLLRRRDCPFPPDRLAGALAAAGIETTVRPERVAPEQFLALANALAGR
jgi:16S rRNA A1518/A1519 N6-dimethyltransferase RsmA/KsgA/DIM1 with predicted DNA glycosylase/AP lyase activity